MILISNIRFIHVYTIYPWEPGIQKKFRFGTLHENEGRGGGVPYAAVSYSVNACISVILCTAESAPKLLSKIQTVKLQFVDNWIELTMSWEANMISKIWPHANSYSVPLKTLKTKLELIYPKDVGDTF